MEVSGTRTSADAQWTSRPARLAITLVVLGMAAALSWVMAPGFSPDALAALGPLPVSRLSIVALEFIPVSTAMILVESLKLVFHDGGRRETRRFDKALVPLAIAFALLQGWGVANALQEIKAPVPLVEEPGAAFIVSFMLAQAAGTALLMILADGITRHGIGSGFWLMLVAFELAALAGVLVTLSSSPAALDPVLVLALLGVAGGGIAAVIWLFGQGVASGLAPQESAAHLILPVFIGAAIAWLVYSLLMLPVSLTDGADYPAWTDLLRYGLLAAAIFIVARLRIADKGRATRIAATGAALSIALDAIATRLAFGFVSGSTLIIATTIAALAWHQTRDR